MQEDEEEEVEEQGGNLRCARCGAFRSNSIVTCAHRSQRLRFSDATIDATRSWTRFTMIIPLQLRTNCDAISKRLAICGQDAPGSGTSRYCGSRACLLRAFPNSDPETAPPRCPDEQEREREREREREGGRERRKAISLSRAARLS